MKALLAVGVIMAMVTAPVTRADESQYIADLVKAGISINDVNLELRLGYGICAALTTNGVAGVNTEAREGINSGMDPFKVGEELRIAVDNLCPANLLVLEEWAKEHQPKPPQQVD